MSGTWVYLEIVECFFFRAHKLKRFLGSFFRVYLASKQWEELKVFNDHTAAATGVRFGRHAQYIASTSMDRTLKIYGLNN